MTLVSSDSTNIPAVRQAVAEVKELAHREGLYVVAGRIEVELKELAQQLDEFPHYRLDRGYLLAADLVFRHILQQLDLLKTDPHAVGPNILTNFCSTLLECILEGRNSRLSIEVPVILTDNLLGRVLDNRRNAVLYLEFADRMLRHSLQFVEQRAELDQREFRRATHLLKKGSDEASAVKPRIHRLDFESVYFFQRFQETIASIPQRIADSKDLNGLMQEDDQQWGARMAATRQLAFLNALVPISEAVGYRVFTALIYERAARLVRKAQPEKSRECCRVAGELYEAQGDYEKELLFADLATARFTRALDCFRKADAPGRSDEINRKIEECRKMLEENGESAGGFAQPTRRAANDAG